MRQNKAKTCKYNQISLENNKRKVRVPISTYALFLFFLLSMFNTHQFGVSLSGVIIPILLYVFFSLIDRKRFSFTISHLIILLFWLLAVISTLLSDIVTPQRDIFTFLIFVLFFIASTSKRYTEKEIKLLIGIYIFIATLASINIIWNFINDFAYGWKRYSLYFGGVYRDPNYVSSFILPAITILFYRILKGFISIKRKLLVYTIFAVLVLGILCTGSRAAFFVLGVVILVTYLYYLRTIKNIKMVVKTLVILILAIIAWQIIKEILPEFLLTRLTNFGAYTETSRLKLWSTGMNLFYTSPLFGQGLGSLREYLFQVGLYDSHNLYLDILIGQGIIGITLLVLMFIRFVIVNKVDKPFLILLLISSFAPLIFINGFNTASFWAPMIFCEILSNYSRYTRGGLRNTLVSL